MRYLITGGAGFLGTNFTENLLKQGHFVCVYDNLARPGGGSAKNIEHLKEKFGKSKNFVFVKESVTDLEKLKGTMKDFDFIYHFAAQTAMTTSITNPVDDFAANATGSFNVLEAARQKNDNAVLMYASTNKVYGNLLDIKLVEREKRWDFQDKKLFEGISEAQPINPESPYGCSKYAGDAYFQDYFRTYGLKTTVFRCSAMYGGQQHVLEDQGWVGWFLKRASRDQEVTIYGDGKQVRDILYVDDVFNAFMLAGENIQKTKGSVYNLGGGRQNSISILELIDFIKKNFNKELRNKFGPWRLGDQKVYITNSAKAANDFGWKPRVGFEEGIKRQYEWICKS